MNEVIDALATARLSRLLVEDRIPLGWVRDRLVRRAHRQNAGAVGLALARGEEPPVPYVADLLSCSWCASVWVAFGVVAVRRYRWWRPVALALAFSQAAGMCAEWVER